MEEILIIVGPTAVGKTEIAIALAEDIGAEIISADSMQVYRGMDIGTAKPTKEERARVRHHLIDIADPREDFSVGDYLVLAEKAIDDIKKRGKTPLVVGGTGLYVRAITDGLFDGPKADRALRDELMERERTGGVGTLYAALKDADPESAARVHPSDMRRIVRALEVYYKEGRPISSFHESHRAASERRPVRIAGFKMDRALLYRRIEDRVDTMMAAGLLNEVKALKETGCERGMVSMQALGYKQLMAHLDGEYALDEAVRLVKKETKRYAKRQFTWWGAEERVRWVDLTGLSRPVEALKKALEIF